MDWTRGPTIGRGATATVHLATDNRSGELFAVKSAEFSRCFFLQKEQSFLSKLASSRIVKYLGFSLTTEDNIPMYNLCIEYVPNGTLFDVIRSKGRLDESVIKLYTHQILQGLDHLHQNGIVHCDIKSRNVLIGGDGVKIADLGCAKLTGESDCGEDSNCPKFSGTPAFMAPEVARGEKQGFEADVWALGCTVIEMATSSGPWPEMRDSPVVSALYRIGYSDSEPEFPMGFSEEGKDFLSKCLKRDWKQRWTVKELLDHPFLQVLEVRSEQECKAKMSSPSSVLDKDLWDFTEVSDHSQQELGFEEASALSSAEERIKILIGTERFSDWSSLDDNDEDWLTIRSNESCEDIQGFTETIEDELISETSMVLVDHEVVSDIYIFGDELSLNYSLGILGDVFRDTSFVMPCNHHMEIDNETFCFDSISVSFFFFCQFRFMSFFFFLLLNHCNYHFFSSLTCSLFFFNFARTRGFKIVEVFHLIVQIFLEGL